MTALRKEVNDLLDNMSDDKLSFIIQIIRGVNELTNDGKIEREEAFANLEKLCRKVDNIDVDKELSLYRDEKYGN